MKDTKRNLKNLKGNLILLLAAFIWGFAFVAQDQAAEVVEPFTLNGIRFIIGALVLLPFILAGAKRNQKPLFAKTKENKTLLKAGLLCGILLCIAVNFQQFGIAIYPAEAAASGRSGFITALYVILVPLFGLFQKKRTGAGLWISVLMAVGGMYLLCFGQGVSGIYPGDIIVVCCAVAFSFQILCIDRYGDALDSIRLSALQFTVCGILSLVLMAIFDHPVWTDILSAWKPILYTGVLSSGIAYTLQILGQKYAENPAVASIIMSLESVFAAIGGALILHERLSVRECIGCLIMFAAIVLAQLTSAPRKENA